MSVPDEVVRKVHPGVPPRGRLDKSFLIQWLASFWPLQIRQCKGVTGKFFITNELRVNYSLQTSYDEHRSEKEKPRSVTGVFFHSFYSSGWMETHAPGYERHKYFC